jgi:hypothetical protein
MAQRTIITVHDDLDGTEAAETVKFGLDGASYEIDLSEEHAKELRHSLSAYVAAARRATPTGKTYRTTLVAPDPAAVRAWARSHNIEIPARGRLPRTVIDQFTAANA